VASPQGNRVDPYYWIRDDDPKSKRPEIIAYLEAENAYTAAATRHLKALEAQLLREMRGRVKEDDSSAADFQHGYWYSTRFELGAEYPIYERQAGTTAGPDATAPIERMLDGPALAKGKRFFSVGAVEPSPDNRWIAWTSDESGRRISTLRFRDVRAGTDSPESIPGVLESLAWASDSQTVFYIRQDPVLLQSGPIYRHRVGTDPATDTLVYNEADPTLVAGIESSRDQEWVLLTLEGFDFNELRAIPSAAPEEAPRVILPRKHGVRSYADFASGRWLIRTNEGAVNFKLVEAPEGAPSDRAQWRTLVDARPATSLDDFAIFEGAIALSERSQANSVVRVIGWGSTPAAGFTVAADESAFTMNLGSNLDSAMPCVRVVYTSMITPRTTWDVSLATGERLVRKVQPVLGYDASLYASERVWAPARDGALIPVSLAWRKDRYKRDGSAPIYQDGYGAYGISFDAEFSSNQVSLLDRGFLVATAHVRGGADMGQEWYEAGRLSNKRNSFNDFVDATKFLVRERYGSAQSVFAVGGSAGGLLMGAVANQAPDLYKGIALHVPFVDALTTMLDETIPLTANEWTQWGDPREKTAYDYIFSYSPYDNIEAKEYPAMLVTTGLWDSQVQYYEPAKYVAKMRAMRTDNNPLLLRVNMSSGHGGDSGRFELMKQVALEYAFFIDLAGIPASQ
jgi:oligopeptidase B